MRVSRAAFAVRTALHENRKHTLAMGEKAGSPRLSTRPTRVPLVRVLIRVIPSDAQEKSH